MLINRQAHTHALTLQEGGEDGEEIREKGEIMEEGEIMEGEGGER